MVMVTKKQPKCNIDSSGVRLYVNCDDDKSFYAPVAIAEAMMLFEERVYKDEASQFDLGFYYALEEIMSTPMLLLEDVLERLEDESDDDAKGSKVNMYKAGIAECVFVFNDTIINNIPVEILDRLEDLCSDVQWKKACDNYEEAVEDASTPDKVHPDVEDAALEEQLAEEEEVEEDTSDIPMTSGELHSWYIKVEGLVIQRWHYMTYRERWNEYTNYIDETRDLTDEELLAEFEAEAAQLVGLKS